MTRRRDRPIGAILAALLTIFRQSATETCPCLSIDLATDVLTSLKYGEDGEKPQLIVTFGTSEPPDDKPVTLTSGLLSDLPK